MSNVALLETVDSSARGIFTDAGHELSTFPPGISTEGLSDLARHNQAIGIRSKPRIDAEVFVGDIALEAIGCYCIGIDQIDIEAASARGISIFNSRYENTRSVVELTMGNIIALFRRVGEHNQSMHSGVWSKTEEDSYEVREKTLGIVGYGSIGSQVSVEAESFGMNVKYYDPEPKLSYKNAERVDSLEELLSQVDVVTLHVPGTPRTKNMINARTIAHMKPGSYLINTSRGDVVDYEALRDAITGGHLGGAAVDVFKPEPSKRGDPFEHPLRGLPSVILTPHIGGSTIESSRGIAHDTTGKLMGYMNYGNSVGSVNIPEIDLGEIPEGTARILHIHENVPGVEAEVSAAIASAGLNKVGIALKTRDGLGYVAIDVEGTVTPELRQLIAAVPHTIRDRVVFG